MLRLLACSFSVLIALAIVSTDAWAIGPAECSPIRVAQAYSAADPCTWVRSGKVPQRQQTTVKLVCIDYRKMTGLYGKVGMFALRDFDPTNLAQLQQQLDRAVFKDHYETGPIDFWCRGEHWFKDATWVVFCDEFGGIGWITGDSFQYARRNTWPPGRQPVVMGLRSRLTALR